MSPGAGINGTLPESGRGAADRIAVAVIALGCLYSCAMAFRDIRYLVAHVADDACYYFRIAENAALGYGFTFDRINPTNGFHPLWAWLLIAIRRVLPLDPEGMFRAVWIVQSLMLTAATWILWRLLRRHTGAWPAAFGVVLFAGRLYFTGRDGMESALVLLVALLLLDRLDRWIAAGASSPLRAVIVGLLLGVLVLARLDSLFVCGALGAAWFLAEWRRRAAGGRPGDALLAGGVAALVVAPYLVSNYFAFGHLVPISGVLKSSFPHPAWHTAPVDPRSGGGPVLALATLLGVWLIVRALLPRRHPRADFMTFPLAPFAAGVLVHELYSVMFMTWGVFEWHFILLRLLLAMALPVLMARLPFAGTPPGRMALAVATALLALASAALIARKDWRADYSRSWTVQAYEAAVWADRTLPADAVLAMKDAGVFGYCSRRRVVNVDGLVNGYEYQDSLKAGRFEGFLRAKGVEFYVQHAIPNRPDITAGDYDTLRFVARSVLYDRPGGELPLARADELYRSKPFPVGPDSCVFLVWRMPAR